MRHPLWRKYILMILLLVVFISCNRKSGSSETTSIKFQQYYVQGKQLYIQHCSNCHQENGTGLGLIYPPLNKSDYMENNFADVICLIRYGKQGEIIVNGKSYIQEMPGITSLTDLEIAEIVTYIYNTWEHKHGIADVKTVTPILATCKGIDP